MSLDGISNTLGVTALDGPEVDLRTAARQLSQPQQNSASEFEGGAEPETTRPFDLFEALGDLFNGQPQGNGKDAANTFDLGAILSSIFDFAGKQVTPPREEHHAGVQERVEVSGETGDEHFQAKGRAAAEAHAKAETFSETFIDGDGVGVRGGAEASAGVSAEAEGSLVTDVGSIDGKAKVSAEVYARLYGEARAGPNGVGASGKAEVGAMANADAETNLQIADGLVAGHADAHAEAGAGGKATGKVGVSFDPPEAVVKAKAESFAGARAGYSAKGGIAGVGYGIEAELWAGAGAKVEVNGGLDQDGKFKIEFSIGIAAGVGAMMKINFEFDTKVFGKIVGDVVSAAGDVLGDLVGAVAGLFDGGKGDGAHAGRTISAAIRQVAPMIGEASASAAKKELDDQQASAPAALEKEQAPKKPQIITMGQRGTLLEGSLS